MGIRGKELIALLCTHVLKLYQQKLVQLAELKAAATYVKTVRVLRLVAAGIVGLLVCTSLLTTSLLVMIIAVVHYLDWDPQAKAMLLFGCSALLFLIAVGVLAYGLSDKTWMKASRADELVARVTDHH